MRLQDKGDREVLVVDKKNNFISLILDTIHFILAFLIVLLAILVYLDAESNMIFFPIIFFCSAMICIVQIVKIYKGIAEYRYMRASLCFYVSMSAFFVLFALISLVRM